MNVDPRDQCGEPHNTDRDIRCILRAGHPGRHKATMAVRWTA